MEVYARSVLGPGFHRGRQRLGIEGFFGGSRDALRRHGQSIHLDCAAFRVHRGVSPDHFLVGPEVKRFRSPATQTTALAACAFASAGRSPHGICYLFVTDNALAYGPVRK